MIKTLPDIESFDHIVTRLFEEVEDANSESFDIYSYGQKIGLDTIEIDTIYYHLKRSSMIESINESEVKISEYGHMLHNGQINHGYVPI